MPYTKTIVCLANSYKPPAGRCVAGREIIADGKYGGWIRPVSARTTRELSVAEYSYGDRTGPKLLDIVEVPLLEPVPHGHQTENHLIDPDRKWVKSGTFSRNDLEALRDSPASIWINSLHSKLGLFDRISASEAATLDSSLLLIEISDFEVKIGSKTWNDQTVRTYRGKFRYNGTNYNLSCTDPTSRSAFDARGEGDYPMGSNYVCLSLTEPFKTDGLCYKVIAAIVSNPPL